MALWVVIVGFLIGFCLAFAIGANDVANSFGTSVGSKVLTLRKACILASIFETAGAVLIGTKVSSTISKGIIDVDLYADDVAMLELGYLAALIGAFVWLFAATWFKLPVSGTHSIVGSVIGFTVIAKGTSGVNWMVLVKIVASWFISPMFSGIISAGIYFFLQLVILKLPDHRDQLERGIFLLPFFYAFTCAINAFTVFLDGPRMLYFHLIPIWGSVLASLLVGTIAAVLAKLILAPRLKVDIIYRRPTLRQVYQIPEIEIQPPTPVAKVALIDAQTSVNETDYERNSDRRHAESFATIADGDWEPISRKSTLKSTFDGESFQRKVSFAAESTESSSASALSLITPFIPPEDFVAAEQVILEEIPQSPNEVEYAGIFKLFALLQILTACFGAFAHGGNDVSNAVGPVIGLYSLYLSNSASSATEPEIWILLLGGVAISLGLWIMGRRVIETVGSDLTEITPPSGFSIELGAATTVLIASQAYVPVSTTHCKIGSVVMVGIAKGGRKQIDWKIFRNIIVAWCITVPASGLISAGVMWLLKTFAYFPIMNSMLISANASNSTTMQMFSE